MFCKSDVPERVRVVERVPERDRVTDGLTVRVLFRENRSRKQVAVRRESAVTVATVATAAVAQSS